MLLAVRFGRWVSPGDENTSAFRLRGGRGIWRWRVIWRIWREAPAGPQAGGPRWRGIWRSPLEGLVLGLHWHTLHQIQIPRSSPTLLASVGLMSESPTVTESDSVMVNLNIMSRRYPSPGAGPSDSLALAGCCSHHDDGWLRNSRLYASATSWGQQRILRRLNIVLPRNRDGCYCFGYRTPLQLQLVEVQAIMDWPGHCTCETEAYASGSALGI